MFVRVISQVLLTQKLPLVIEKVTLVQIDNCSYFYCVFVTLQDGFIVQELNLHEVNKNQQQSCCFLSKILLLDECHMNFTLVSQEIILPNHDSQQYNQNVCLPNYYCHAFHIVVYASHCNVTNSKLQQRKTLILKLVIQAVNCYYQIN